MASFMDRLFGRKTESADLAKERLKLVLIHDRTDLNSSLPGKYEDEDYSGDFPLYRNRSQGRANFGSARRQRAASRRGYPLEKLGEEGAARLMESMRSVNWRHFDFWLFGAVVILSIFGIAMIRSAIAGSESLADSVPRQIIFTAIGLVVIFIVTIVDYHFWASLTKPMYIVVILS